MGRSGRRRPNGTGVDVEVVGRDGQASHMLKREAREGVGAPAGPGTTTHGEATSPVIRWLGIDFSGSHLKWRSGCGTSNVWIAEVEERNRRLRIADLRRVQDLKGKDSPFLRLVRRLQQRDFAAAGIDAPLSIPARFVPKGHDHLLRLVDRLKCEGRPFPRAGLFVDALWPVASRSRAHVLKPLRETEHASGVSARSTLWSGPRGGAAMTVAALKLLAQVRGPVWPWASSRKEGLLVEAFPAVQLRAWRLPHQGYNGADGRAVRRKIVSRLRDHLDFGAWEAPLLRSADALDAVICSFAGRAVKEEGLANLCTTNKADVEGQIAIHRSLSEH